MRSDHAVCHAETSQREHEPKARYQKIGRLHGWCCPLDFSQGAKDFAMRSHLHALAAALALCLPSATAWAQPQPNGPTNSAVLLPPQAFDDSAKKPNTTRENHGEWSIWGGVYLRSEEHTSELQ